MSKRTAMRERGGSAVWFAIVTWNVMTPFGVFETPTDVMSGATRSSMLRWSPTASSNATSALACVPVSNVTSAAMNARRRSLVLTHGMLSTVLRPLPVGIRPSQPRLRMRGLCNPRGMERRVDGRRRRSGVVKQGLDQARDGSSPSLDGSRRRDGRRPPDGDLEMIEGINRALGLLHGKWKVHLVFFMARGIHRHSRLLDCLPGASKKVMIDTLRALERDGLVVRRIYPEVPVRVEYSL